MTWTRHTISADGPIERLEEFHRLFFERIGLRFGRVWVADDADAVVGVDHTGDR